MTTNVSVWRSDEAARREAGHDWVRWLDVRIPVTIAEGEAALDLIATKVAGLEKMIADVPDRAGAAQYALRKWEERLAEVEWTMERLRAGDALPSMDLARERAAHAETVKKLDAARVQVKSLETKVAMLSQQRSKGDEKTIAGLREQVAVLFAGLGKRDAMIAALRTPEGEVPIIARGVDPRGAAKMHETAAAALEAIDDMVAGGAQHTRLSRYTEWKLASILPVGYRVLWRDVHLARSVEAAETFVAIERGQEVAR